MTGIVWKPSVCPHLAEERGPFSSAPPVGGTCSPPADFDIAFSMEMVSHLFQSKFTDGCARPTTGYLG